LYEFPDLVAGLAPQADLRSRSWPCQTAPIHQLPHVDATLDRARTWCGRRCPASEASYSPNGIRFLLM